jgi:DNA ligase-1
MKRFAELLDRLSYEPGRNAKLRLIADYLRTTPDPDRGWALAALTGALSFQYAKAGMIRALIAERTDPALFALSYDYVGDLSETVALMWPVPLPPRSGGEGRRKRPPSRLWLKRSPLSARRNCRRRSRAGSIRSTRQGAGRCSSF